MKNSTFPLFLLKLQSLILEHPNYDIEDETLYELQGFPFFELGFDSHIENFGIYLAFTYNEEHKGFFDELFINWHSLIPIVQPYLESLFSENTNNDACSFNINWDTDHANTSDDGESYWELKLSVTDYLS